MLKVSGFAPGSGAPDVELDVYVPFTLTWPGYRRMTDAPAYYQVGGGMNAHLELKFDRSSGVLVELAAISVTAIAESAGNAPCPGTPPDDVLPVCDLAALGPQLALGDDRALAFTAYPDAFDIRIGDREPVTHRGDAVVFGLAADDTLASVRFHWTDRQRREILRDHGG
ncbi:hypothetical protein ABZ816_25070 [Actinosynnema sp. NPDC047251]|uniref:Uncharacterized protein n=1 Tax=Saccharothrix espanaensis (strain ATCC 51144 / DSM 44229 / JCM 9112 / NBRC 15066 / NRRL 15764) TaxID=1179773 RepID=K0K575_SACES|nr:hypothetical protein [Saccharothrix espanaensis]CCH31678.1 hypothetical protein BN6_43960 [Saccharothrix espanaensis DSM 44229]